MTCFIGSVVIRCLCAGNDKVFELLEDVLAEIIDLFPSKYIHIGADEVPPVIGVDLGTAVSALNRAGFEVRLEWKDGGNLPQATLFERLAHGAAGCVGPIQGRS